MSTDILINAVSGIGAFEEQEDGQTVFERGEEWLENLQDVQRFVRRDNESRDTQRLLGGWNVVRNSLAPLLLKYWKDEEVQIAACKVLVMLTLPLHPSTPNPTSHLPYLQDYKSAFLSNDLIAVLVAVIAAPLRSIASGDAQEVDYQLVELVLTLLRNILLIPEPADPQSPNSGQQYILLRLFHEENVLELLLTLANSIHLKREWSVLLLEIFYMTFHTESVQSLWDARHVQEEGDFADMEIDGEKKREDRLKKLLQKSRNSLHQAANYRSGRHPRFVGAFTINELGAEYIHHGLSPKGFQLRSPQTRSPHQRYSGKTLHSSYIGGGGGSGDRSLNARAVQHILCNFAVQFIDCGYSVLMNAVKEDILADSATILPQDRLNFLFLLQLCTGIHFMSESDRVSKENQQIAMSPLSSTLDYDTFAFVCGMLEERSTPPLAIASLDQMLRLLSLAMKHGTDTVSAACERLCLRLFYDSTLLLDKVVILLRNYRIRKYGIRTLEDLVMLTDVVLELVKYLSSRGELFVRRRRRSARKKLRALDDEEAEEATRKKLESRFHEHADNRADDSGEKVNDVKATLVASVGEEATGDVKREEGQTQPGESEDLEANGPNFESESRVAASDRGNQPTESISAGIDEDQAPDDDNKKASGELASSLQEREIVATSMMDAEDEAEEDEIEDRQLQYEAFIGEFCSHSTVNVCGTLLLFFLRGEASENSVEAVLRVFNEIAEECMPVLYQLSIFRVFDLVMNAENIRGQIVSDLRQFIARVLSMFFLQATDDSTFYLRLMCRRTKAENKYLMRGTTIIRTEDEVVEWLEEEDLLLRRLSDYRFSRVNPLKLISEILPSKTHEQILDRLKVLGIDVSEWKTAESSKQSPPEIHFTKNMHSDTSDSELGHLHPNDEQEEHEQRTPKKRRLIRKSSLSAEDDDFVDHEQKELASDIDNTSVVDDKAGSEIDKKQEEMTKHALSLEDIFESDDLEDHDPEDYAADDVQVREEGLQEEEMSVPTKKSRRYSLVVDDEKEDFYS